MKLRRIRTWLAALAIAFAGFAAVGCGGDNGNDDNVNEGVGDQIEQSAKDAEDAVKDKADEARDAADDAGDKIEKETDEATDKIDDATNDLDKEIEGDG